MVASNAHRSLPLPRLFLGAVLITTIIGLMLAVRTYGTNDILFLKSYAVKAQKVGVAPLYREGANLVEFHPDWVEQMAHPPGVIHLWLVTDWMEQTTGVPFRVWFRILTMLAQILTACVLYHMVSGRFAIAFVLCPAAIMISAFHGNSDPIVVLFLICAVLCAEEGRSAILVGLLFALACSVKVWPLFLVPAFLLSFTSWRRRIAFLAVASAGWLLLGAPYMFQFPALILRTVFGYRSVGGWWALRHGRGIPTVRHRHRVWKCPSADAISALEGRAAIRSCRRVYRKLSRVHAWVWRSVSGMDSSVLLPAGMARDSRPVCGQ